MSQIDPDIFIDNGETNRIKQEHEGELYSLFEPVQQVQNTCEPRLLSKAEESIVKKINICFTNWYEPWKKTFLADGREFKIVYDLMEDLLHYEYQITNRNSVLSNDRANAIAQAVARLVDYGNAILNIDLIIRANDETSSEIDPNNVTTVELYQAHVKAHNLRQKLLNDYFKKDKPSSTSGGDDTSSPTNGILPLVTLQVPSVPTQPMQLSPTLERSHRASIGSSTSINTEGRRTPQHIPTSQIEIKIPPTDLSSQIEMTHMTATIRSSAFSQSHSSTTRIALLPGILAKIENLLTVPTNAEKIANCFELLDALLNTIEKLPVESRNKEVTMISIALLKPIVRKVYIDDRDSFVEFQHAHWTTCLLSIIRLMTAADFNTYLRHFSNLADLGAFLKDYLFIVRRLISTRSASVSPTHLVMNDINNVNNPGSTYPDCWIEMSLLACSTFLTSLTYLYQILRQFFASNLQMWLSFIDCLVHFILQDTLKPDRLMLKERQCLLAEDLRQTSAEYVWISWDSLNFNQKQQLLEDLIEPLLRACVTLYSRQRSILLPIFYDMMRCDYTSQYITPRGSMFGSSSSTLHGRRDLHNDFILDDDLESLPPIIQSKSSTSPSKTNESLPYLSCNDQTSEDGTVLTKFTHLIVGKLNTLMIDLGLSDEHFKNELCAAISGDLNPKYYNRNSFSSSTDIGQFRNMAKHTSDLIAEFMQICLDSRQANRLAYKHLYLLCLFKLILFFRDKVDRAELYLNYLYKLCHLHHGAGRYVEAGYTLLEHAKTLPWSNRPLDNQNRIVTKFFNVPHQLTDYSSLKIFLYNTIMEYFDQGQIWEAGVPLCRELVDLYEYKTYEYSKVAQLLEKMSAFFNNIVDVRSRSNPEYFRVTFYGIGFPVSIRNATMVYRGKPYEKLGDFQKTLLSKYPDAKLLTSLAKPDESILNELDARYLQINACSPVVDLKSKFGPLLSKVEDSILNYYRHNECDKFNFSRRISRPMNEYMMSGGTETSSSSTSQVSSDDNFANMWRERTTLTTNTLPGILQFFPVFLIETSTVSPIESAIEDLERTNDRLSCMVNRFKADKRQAEDVRLLGQLLLGIIDAAVNGGITKYEEAFFTSKAPSASLSTSNLGSNFERSLYVSCVPPEERHKQHQKQQGTGPPNNNTSHDRQTPIASDQHHNMLERPSAVEVDKLKCLIAQQVPLLDEAIRLHRDRVADVMRPQHEHLEASYKKLKHHIMTKYSRYLPSDYSRSTIRSYKSLARSPNRSMRSESKLPLMMASVSGSRFPISKRLSDAGIAKPITLDLPLDSSGGSSPPTSSSSNIPYKQLGNERRSLPFLTGVPSVDRDVIRDSTAASARRPRSPPALPSILIGGVGQYAETASYSEHKPPMPALRSSIKGGGELVVSSQATNEIYTSTPVAAVRRDNTSQQSYMRLISDNSKMSNLNDRYADQGKLYDDSDDEEDSETRLVVNESLSSGGRKPSDTDDVKLVSF